MLINHCKIVAKSLQNLSLPWSLLSMNQCFIWISSSSCLLKQSQHFLSWGQFLFPGKILWSLLPLLLLRLDNVGTAGLKTTPNTLDWHLLPLFAGRLKVTYQGFDSHPDTYFMAAAEIKKLLSANLFQINQPNNLDLWIKSFFRSGSLNIVWTWMPNDIETHILNLSKTIIERMDIDSIYGIIV